MLRELRDEDGRLLGFENDSDIPITVTGTVLGVETQRFMVAPGEVVRVRCDASPVTTWSGSITIDRAAG